MDAKRSRRRPVFRISASSWTARCQGWTTTSPNRWSPNSWRRLSKSGCRWPTTRPSNRYPQAPGPHRLLLSRVAQAPGHGERHGVHDAPPLRGSGPQAELLGGMLGTKVGGAMGLRFADRRSADGATQDVISGPPRVRPAVGRPSSRRPGKGGTRRGPRREDLTHLLGEAFNAERFGEDRAAGFQPNSSL